MDSYPIAPAKLKRLCSTAQAFRMIFVRAIEELMRIVSTRQQTFGVASQLTSAGRF